MCIRDRGSLTEADINTAMREVKLALLEADVNFKVVKEFVAAVKEKADVYKRQAETLKLLTGRESVLRNRLLMMDLLHHQYELIDFGE